MIYVQGPLRGKVAESSFLPSPMKQYFCSFVSNRTGEERTENHAWRTENRWSPGGDAFLATINTA